MWLDVQGRDGSVATIEVVVRRDTVELRCNDRLAGVADRDLLRAWLADPIETFAYDDLLWIAWPTGDVALAVDDDVPAAVLPHHIVTGLRAHV